MDKVAELTKEEVQRKLDKGRFLSSAPKKEYDPNLRSEVYNVINVIYDTKLKQRLKMWYQCTKCNKILKAQAKTGNGSLRYHPCFEKWKQQTQSAQTKTYDSSDDEELQDETGDMNDDKSDGGGSISVRVRKTKQAQSDKNKKMDKFIELGRELGIEIPQKTLAGTLIEPGKFVKAPNKSESSSSDE